ncbi:MAG: AAA family ATPase [Gammaproteobacteria bacterium]|jgi:putative secretion ATPase (PEP-CTERM system associated)
MYCELFQLEEQPFRLTPDPQFLFASKQHARAKAYMESSIWLADGFVVITGEIGSGKTTLIESFLEELPENVVLAHVNQTQLTSVELLQAILVELGFKPFGKEKVELLYMLKEHMIELYAEGKTLLLIIDEAQNLTRTVLEEVRMISGIEAQKEKLLRIILAGQPELADELASPELKQLKQRVRLQFHLGALSNAETREYIEHRLAIAGSQGREIFEDDAFDLIFGYTGGVPRLINTLCDTAMLCGFAEEKDVISKKLVMTAIEELQWPPAVGEGSEEQAQAEADEADDDLGHTRSISPSPARFDVMLKGKVVSEFDLPLGRTVIGRTADNDLQIASKFVSRHHAQVTTTPESCTLEDLNSTNGIFIKSRRVKRHPLVEGDIIHLGEHKLVYRDLRSGTSAFKIVEDTPEECDEEEVFEQKVSGGDAD